MGISEELQFGTCKLWQTLGKSKEKGVSAFIGFQEEAGMIVLNRSPLVGKECPRFWQFCIGSKRRAVAVAEANREEIFLSCWLCKLP